MRHSDSPTFKAHYVHISSFSVHVYEPRKLEYSPENQSLGVLITPQTSEIH